MKFGATLKQSAVPEWRKAYINYSGLKKQIKKAVAEDESSGERASGEQDDSEDSTGEREEEEADTEGNDSGADPQALEAGTMRPTQSEPQHLDRSQSASSSASSTHSPPPPPPPQADERLGEARSGSGLRLRHAATSAASAASRRRPPGSSSQHAAPSMMSGRWRFAPNTPIPFLMGHLKPEKRKFFTMLFSELDKVSAFFNEREADVVQRYKALQDQLDELAEHRLRHEQPHGFIAKSLKRPIKHATGRSADFVNGPSSKVENFATARKALRSALNELYKLLNFLQSYKDVNRTGFSKILKKFEKATWIPCSTQFMTRVNQSNFVQSTKTDELISGVEQLYALHFTAGNKKRARDTLRVQDGPERHHFSAARAGLYIGLSIPAIASGLQKALNPAHQASLPEWPRLLQLFGALGQPVVFACLFALCLEVYRKYRINYILIFELDIRTRIDSVQYLELPAFLLLIFSYCFWLSFSNFWPNHIVAWAWPLVFVVAALAIILNPFPGFNVNARYWLIRRTARAFTGGLLHVEFMDFWLGDEFCSLYYTFYNFGLLVCAFDREFRGVPPACSTNSMWSSPCLASIPYILRATQSIRRYRDSYGKKTHLVNFGKYSMSILYMFLYFNWRIEHGSSPNHPSYAVWILFAVINAMWSFSWDVTMDWNLLNRHVAKPLLRRELVFKDIWGVYYLAVVLDFLLRFAWVLYLFPAQNFSVPLRGFVVSSLEVLRRVMWNFFRIESEHTGNTDGFRVTRDVPLPYHIPDRVAVPGEDYDAMENDLQPQSRAHRLRSTIIERLHPRSRSSKQHRKSQEQQQRAFDEPPTAHFATDEQPASPNGGQLDDDAGGELPPSKHQSLDSKASS